MKVTVCFGETRFVVPCPPGTTVLKLEQEAILRYKRKNPDSWVVVHHLQSQSGILDPEDNISDVADDREELIASFEDAGAGPDPGVQQGGGDGASGSSVGTGSPDIFQVAPGTVVGSNNGTGGGGAGGADGPGAVVVVVPPTVSTSSQQPPSAGGTASIISSTDTTTASASAAAAAAAAAGGSAGGGSGGVTTTTTTTGGSCIEVTANEPVPLGLGLQVRRGSEPSLHQIGVTDQRSPLYNVNPNGHHQETTKRWSAAPVCRSDDAAAAGGGGGTTPGGGNLSVAAYLMSSPEWNVPEEDVSSSSPPPPTSAQAFNRFGRLSMQFLGADATTSGYRWMEAAEKAATGSHHHHHHYQQQHQTSNHQQGNGSSSSYQQQPYHHHHQHSHSGIYQSPSSSSSHSIGGGGGSANNSFSTKSLPRESTRKEPLGQAKPIDDSIREKESEMLLVVNETGGPLGLTAIPDAERGGLLVQSVESGSRAERGRVRRGDRILEINGIKLVGLSEVSVQEHLRKSLASTELRLWVIRGSKHQQQQQQKSNGSDGSVAALSRLVTGGSGSRYQRRTTTTATGSQMIEAEELPAPAKVATVSPTRKMPGGPSTAAASLLQVANTRKLGKRIEITLTKGDHGLGFSVTTRDNPAGGHCPIYIKNILPKGAAVEDGRLKPGDRLLEVEGIPMTGKSQTEVVSILRGTPHGATLTLVVSRQQELAADSKEREIGFGVEHEPKNSPPKPPAPVMPKPSSLKQQQQQQQQSPSKTGKTGSSSDSNSYVTMTGGSYSSVAKHTANGSGTPKTPTVHKKPLASILKSASTNQMTELFQQQQQQQDSVLLNGGSSLASGGGGSSSITSSGSLAGAAWKNREILTLHIPVHDTEKAGLGVSVKGKTGSASGGGSSSNSSSASTTNNGSSSHGNRSSDGDLGIFVKSVLHGGAASRDGRLKMNDQLLSVNGVSLLGQSNAEAMDTLRRAMLQSGGSYPGKIILTVARRIGRPVSTGELLESVDTRTSSTGNGSEQQQQQHSGNGGTTVIYLSPERQQNSKQNDSKVAQQAKRYSNPVLDRLTGGTGTAGRGGSLRGTATNQHHSAHGSSTAQGSSPGSGGVGSLNDNPSLQRNHHAQLNQRGGGGGGGGGGGTTDYSMASPPLTGNGGGSSLRNDSYYLATHDQWNLPSSGLNGNTSSGAVLIEEDPEPNTPTFTSGVGRMTTVVDGGSSVDRNTSTPHGTSGLVDPTYASQLSLETLPSPLDAFSRDAIGRRSMSEKHHAAMDARETGTYQRNKKLREEREREGKLMQLTSGSGASGGGGGSMESIHQMARMSSLKHQQHHGGGTLKLGASSDASTVGTGSHHHQQQLQQQQSSLYAEALDKLGDLGPSLGMKKSSSLESLQTMVQEIQMADEPRGPVALRTPRGRGREEILRAVVERPPEMKAKKHWLLEDATEETNSDGNAGGSPFVVARNTPCQSSLNDGKGGGTKLRPKKSGGLLRGIGHMFRFGKHRKDVVLPSSSGGVTGTMMAADYTTSSGTITKSASSSAANATVQSMASEAWPSDQQQQQQQQQHLQQGHGQSVATATPTSAGSGSYVVYEPGSVERSASSGLIFQHQPPHYQPPPPPPTSNRYSHYVNYDELQQQISRRHHHYHSQRSARNTPPIAELGLQQQHQPQSLHHHHTNAAVGLLGQNLHLAQQKYKSVRPASSYYDSSVGGGYETISHTGPPNAASGGGNTSNSSNNSNTINNNNNESSSSTNHHRKAASSTSIGSGGSLLQSSGKQQSEANVNNNNNSNSSYHHAQHQNMESWHPGPALVGSGNGTGTGSSGVTGAGGSMRNHRGPFVTQVQIQNQYQ